MRVRGWKGVRQASRWLRSRTGARALVLGYHRIAEPAFDPWSLCVSPRRFDEQLGAIRRHARAVSLRELTCALAADEPVQGMVAITFDDGYVDLLEHGLPLLERHGVPATVFVITGALGAEFWWETLARGLDPGRPLPERLRLPLDGESFEWDPGEDGRGAAKRRELLFALHRRLLPLPHGDRLAAVGAIADWAGFDPTGSPAGRSLGGADVARLAGRSLFEVGSHTRTHPALPDLGPEDQRLEIERSKGELEELTGRSVLAFSYPHGRSSGETAGIVRDSGYACACTSRNDLVRPGADAYDLPRFWVPDWSGERFSRWLARWLGRAEARS